MKHIISFSFCTILLLSGCKKEVFIFLPIEEKIEGEWSFEKVEFRKEFSLRRENITNDYRNERLIFEDNWNMNHRFKDTSEDSEGDWFLEMEEYFVGDDTECNNILFVDYTDSQTGNHVSFTWEELSVNKKALRACQRKDGGIYYYKLKRE